MLIPDEFQVNDELYKRLIRPLPNRRDYDRDYPQNASAHFAKSGAGQCWTCLMTCEPPKNKDGFIISTTPIGTHAATAWLPKQ